MRNSLLHVRLTRLRRESVDQGIAIAMVLMVILIVSSLSVLTLGLVLSRVKPTINTANRVAALQTAQSGIDSMVTLIRTSSDGKTTRWDRLPCTDSAPLTGKPTSQKGLHYSAIVTYYDADPSGMSTSQANQHKVRCHSNQSQYALVDSRALDAGGGTVSMQDGNRSMQQVYELRVTNSFLGSGGLLHSTVDQTKCLATGFMIDGLQLIVNPCSLNNPTKTLVGAHFWSYRSDYRLMLTNSPKNRAKIPLCLGPDQLTVGARIPIHECGKAPNQQWGYNDDGEFFLRSGSGDLCIGTKVRTPKIHEYLTMKPCQHSGAPSGSYGSDWLVDNGVGAGAALSTDDSLDNKAVQWVNFAEYGRCIDYAGFGSGKSGRINEYMVYTCKNDPMPNSLAWNQILTYDPIAHQLWTRYGGNQETYASTVSRNATRMCLTSQGQFGQAGLTSCSAGDQNQRWQVYRLVRGDIKVSYTIRRYDGDFNTANDQCLEAGPTIDNEFRSRGFSAVTTQACDGTNAQKWNAPPIITDAGLKDLQENDPS